MSQGAVGSCWGCGSGLGLLHLGYRDSCPQCSRDTRVCRNCEFHDPNCYNECRENQAERVVEKDRATHCDFFRIKKTGKGPAVVDPEVTARQAAEALFRKPGQKHDS
ncbi:MAG: hypothetical protein H7833_18605 [Magnetococcus sp. DMHC-1]|nr:hypothetical protein [Magnetococcales bacterium]